MSFGERLIDRVGPIVLKEVRQGLRAKVFATFFAVLLITCLLVALVAVAQESGRAGDNTLGRNFLRLYLMGLSAVTCFVVPFTAFRSMLREQEEETWVLLLLTGLGGCNIVRGKWVSAMSQALLFASAAAPFVVFTYFLNGIDIPQVIISLLMLAGWTCLLTALAIAIATQAHSRLGRTFAHFVALATLGGGTLVAFAFVSVMAKEGSQLVQQGTFVTFWLGAFVLSLACTWLALEGAGAGLALVSEAASAGPRKAMAAVVLLGLAFGVAACAYHAPTSDAPAAGSVMTSVFLVICGAFAVSEKDGVPARSAGAGWKKPGALRSYWLVVGLLALCTVAWGGVYGVVAGGDSSGKRLRTLLGAPLYPMLYLSAAAFFGRVTALRKMGEPLATRIAFAVTVLLGTVVPPVIARVGAGRGDDELVNALNPVVGMVNFMDRSSQVLDEALLFLAAVTVLFTFLAGTVLHARDGVRAA
jgi:ABC-type transport system involved in multi-copper enzyme maturation permease subunit